MLLFYILLTELRGCVCSAVELAGLKGQKHLHHLSLTFTVSQCFLLLSCLTVVS